MIAICGNSRSLWAIDSFATATAHPASVNKHDVLNTNTFPLESEWLCVWVCSMWTSATRVWKKNVYTIPTCNWKLAQQTTTTLANYATAIHNLCVRSIVYTTTLFGFYTMQLFALITLCLASSTASPTRMHIRTTNSSTYTTTQLRAKPYRHFHSHFSCAAACHHRRRRDWHQHFCWCFLSQKHDRIRTVLHARSDCETRANRIERLHDAIAWTWTIATTVLCVRNVCQSRAPR